MCAAEIDMDGQEASPWNVVKMAPVESLTCPAGSLVGDAFCNITPSLGSQCVLCDSQCLSCLSELKHESNERDSC